MNQKAVAFAGCFFVGAIVLAVYGAGFTWRQVLVGSLALLGYEIGTSLWKAAFPEPKFSRIRFRIEINDLPHALVDSGIYTEEYVLENWKAISESLGQYSGRVLQFTWLEKNLFFMNIGSFFAEKPEFAIEIAPANHPDTKSGLLNHRLELQYSDVGYDLVLVKSADIYKHNRPTPGLSLLKIPYKFFWALQGDSETQKRAHDILAGSTGLKYWDSDTHPSVWGYTGKYVGFRWFPF